VSARWRIGVATGSHVADCADSDRSGFNFGDILLSVVLRSLFIISLIVGLLLIPAGLLGWPLMITDEQARYKRISVRIESIAWPHWNLSDGVRSWQVKRWVPLPLFGRGEEIEVALDPDESSRIYLTHGYCHPLLLLLYGFLLTMGSFLALALLSPPLAQPPPDAMPDFPVLLTADRGKGFTLLLIAAGLAGWVIWDWIAPDPGEPRFSWISGVFRLGSSFLLGLGGFHWMTMTVTVTQSEIVESSWVHANRVDLNSVKTLELEPIYGRKTSNSAGSQRPIVAWLLNFKNAAGERVYSMEDSLSPASELRKVANYMRKRFPVETPR